MLLHRSASGALSLRGMTGCITAGQQEPLRRIPVPYSKECRWSYRLLFPFQGTMHCASRSEQFAREYEVCVRMESMGNPNVCSRCLRPPFVERHSDFSPVTWCT